MLIYSAVERWVKRDELIKFIGIGKTVIIIALLAAVEYSFDLAYIRSSI